MKNEKVKSPVKSLAGLLIYPIFLVVITFIVYANSLHGDFVLDDRFEILRNPVIRNTHNLGVAFKRPFWAIYKKGDFDRPSNYYRPLKTVAYIFAVRIVGADPFRFHIISITLHALVGITVFFLASNFIKNRRFAAIAAIIFIVHPVQSEAVAWIGTSFTDPLYSLFYLLAFYSYLFRGKFPKAGLGLFLSGFLFFAALLSKEPAVSFLPLIMVAQIFFQSPARWKARIFHLGYFFCFFFVYMLMRFNALSGFAPVSQFQNLGILHLLAGAVYLFARYIELLLLPINLQGYHPFIPVLSLLDWRFLVSLALLLIFLSVAAILWNKRSLFFFYMMWFPLTLFLMFYVKSMGITIICERYLYLSMVGYALILSHGVKYLSERFKTERGGAVLYIILIFIIGNYFVLTVKRNCVWKNNLTFYSDCFKYHPESKVLNEDYCTALSDYGTIRQSVRCFENYAREYPLDLTISTHLGNVYARRGSQLLSEGNLNEAEKYFDLAVDKLSNSPFSKFEGTYRKLALILLEKAKIRMLESDFNRAEEAKLAAIRYFEKCKKAVPENNQVRLFLGDVLLMQAQEKRKEAARAQQSGNAGEVDKLNAQSRNMANAALVELEEAVKLTPLNTQVLNSLGAAFRETGQCQKAEGAFEKALGIEPRNDAVLFNMGLNYLECFKKPELAREAFQNLLKIKPNDPRAILYLKQMDSETSPR